MIDIVYPYILPEVNNGGQELKYSLRSLDTYFEDFKVWIVGDKPDWIQNIEHIPMNKESNAWKDVNCKVHKILNMKEISQDFIFMNDDIYFADDMTLEYLSELRATRELNDKVIWDNPYMRGSDSLKAQVNAFVEIRRTQNENNIFPIWDYETHLPRIFSKNKLTKLFDSYDLCNKNIAISTLYYNTYFSGVAPIIYKDNDISNNVVLRFRTNTSYNLDASIQLVSGKMFISNTSKGYWHAEKLLKSIFENKSAFEK